MMYIQVLSKGAFFRYYVLAGAYDASQRFTQESSMKKKDPGIFITEGIEKYMHMVQTVYADTLVMAALYGSAATGSYVYGISDINLLLVVDPPSPSKLFDLGERTFKIVGKYRITPHVLSKSELLGSADVFPVEYLEISSTMDLIHGDNLFEQLDISRKNLRHQVEAMLRGEINSLRQIILAASAKEKLFGRELQQWAGRQFTLYRALLNLAGEKEKSGHTDVRLVTDDLAEIFSLSVTPFHDMEDIREGIKLSKSHKEVVSSLLKEYITMAEKVDGPTYR